MKNLKQHIQEKLQITRNSVKTVFDSIQPISITDKNTISKTFDYLWGALGDQQYIYGNGLKYSLDRIYGKNLPEFKTDLFGYKDKKYKVTELFIDSDYSNRINANLEGINTGNKKQWIFIYLSDLAEVLGKGNKEKGYGVIDYIINEEPVTEKIRITRNKGSNLPSWNNFIYALRDYKAFDTFCLEDLETYKILTKKYGYFTPEVDDGEFRYCRVSSTGKQLFALKYSSGKEVKYPIEDSETFIQYFGYDDKYTRNEQIGIDFYKTLYDECLGKPITEKLQISRNKPIATNPFIVDIAPDDRNWTLDNIGSTFCGHWATDMWHAIDLTKIYNEDSLPKVKNGNNEFTLVGIWIKGEKLLGKILLKNGEISTWQFSTITEFFKTLGLGDEELGKGVYVYIRDTDDINEKLQISRNKPITADYFQVDIFPEAEAYSEKNVIKTLFDAGYKYSNNKVGVKKPYDLSRIYKWGKLPKIDNNGTILNPISLYTVNNRLISDVWCDERNSFETWNWNIGYDEMLKILGHGDEKLGNGVIGYIIYDIKRHG